MKYLISVLIFLIFAGLIFYYLQISKPEKINENSKYEKKQEIKESFFKIKKPNIYSLPARVLYMKIDFKKYRYEIIYKIIIKNIDKYAIFNIKTILENKKIAYSLFKAKKTEIYIFFKNLEQANSVLNLFKEYNFNIKIEKIKKRI